MPQTFVDFGNTWLSRHPGWKMYTWKDDNCHRLKNREAFQRSKAQSGKANILRYEILSSYGGVYIDTDFECLRNIEPILNGVTCFVGQQSPGFANNAIIGSTPSHPFLRDLVEGLPSRLASFSKLPSIKQSGPYYLNERLKGRTDVVSFPQDYFYPYSWHERWRRHERFPGAYAAHHWALSWRNLRRSRTRTGSPALTVMLVNMTRDVNRLVWAIEGLCQQTTSTPFDVVVLDHTHSDAILRTVRAYSSVLKLRYVAAAKSQRGLVSEDAKRHASNCGSPRLLLMDSSCVPDVRLVEEHARYKDDPVVAFSGQRLYPPHKLYPFAPPLDYDALKMHSLEDSRVNRAKVPVEKAWPEVIESCVSVPTHNLAELALPSGIGVRAGGKWVAKQLTSQGYRLLATPHHALVTRLAL